MTRLETTPLVELTRVLYHLDYFRRNFRHISQHKCTNITTPGGVNNNGVKSSCVVCSFKTIFHELSLLMRESVLDPPHIHHVIESSIEDISWRGIGKIGQNSGPRVGNRAVLYESFMRQIEEGTTNNPNPDVLQLHTSFNVTKICLHCRTTHYVEQISQYTMTIDSSTLLGNDWPSFEFAIKTALDGEEFCVQPNCHGQTKVFRLLNTLPSILPICFQADTTTQSVITLLPSRLRPHLIFETSKSIADLHLKAVVLQSPQWGYATLFHHSRLDLWIFMDSRRVLSLSSTWGESRGHPIAEGGGFVVCYAFYCREEVPAEGVVPVLPSKGIQEVPLPRGNLIRRPPPPTPVHSTIPPNQPPSARIYENWPPPQMTVTTPTQNSVVETDSGQGSELSSHCSSSGTASIVTRSPSNASAATTSMPPLATSGSAAPRRPHLILTETVSTPIVEESSPNKYATVRRKMKYQRIAKGIQYQQQSSMSLSVPDLTKLNNPVNNRRQPYHDLENSVSGRQSVVAVEGRNNKVVSFNCEVTLVDDLNGEEYIPHPIFQSVMEKLKRLSAVEV